MEKIENKKIGKKSGFFGEKSEKSDISPSFRRLCSTRLGARPERKSRRFIADKLKKSAINQRFFGKIDDLQIVSCF